MRDFPMFLAGFKPSQDEAEAPAQAPAPAPAAAVSDLPAEVREAWVARAACIVAFIKALAVQQNRSFDEIDKRFGALPINVWRLAESPEGWDVLALMLAGEGQPGGLMRPAVH